MYLRNKVKEMGNFSTPRSGLHWCSTIQVGDGTSSGHRAKYCVDYTIFGDALKDSIVLLQ